MRRLLTFAGLGLAAALAGCASAPQTRVTRFHLEGPIARGQITVEPLLPADRNSLEFQTYASIVGAELARLGFTEAPGLTRSEQVATLVVEHGARSGPPRGSGLSIGLGGGSFGYHGGVGGGVTVPVGSRRPSELSVTRISVQIKRRSDGSVVWEGRAETAARAGSPQDDPNATVRALAAALFKDFPGVSGQTVTVR